jgi:hypothetical protein
MSATVVEAEAMLTTEAMAVMPIRVVITPMTAPIIGMPAAAKAPKVIIRIMKATMSPINSGSSEIGSRQPG